MNIYTEEYENQYNDEMLPATGLAAGVYFIPGIGEVLITATGVVIVGLQVMMFSGSSALLLGSIMLLLGKIQYMGARQ